MRTRRFLATTLGLGALLLGTACAADEVADSGSGSPSGEDKGSVKLLSQGFTEAAIVTNMYKLLLEDAGYTVDMKLVETRDLYMKLLPQEGFDVVPEYVGALADYLNTDVNGVDAEPITSPDTEETLTALEPLATEKGVTLLEPAEASDQNAFFVTQEFADANSLATLSDLAALGEPVVLAAAEDCLERPDCGGGLRDTYGIEISKVLGLGFASPQTYESVLSGESQLGLTSTTDGTLESQGLQLLEDDQSIQPAQNLVPMVRSAFLEENGDVEELLNGLMAELTTDDLIALNGQVANERAEPEDVARGYLEENDLL